MGYPQTRPLVLRSLTANVGMMMWDEDIAEETKLPVKSVQSAVSALIRSGEHNIQTNARGHAWTYLGTVTHPKLDELVGGRVETFKADVNSAYGKLVPPLGTAEKPKEPRVFRHLDHVKWTEKALLLIDEDGNLYRATRI